MLVYVKLATNKSILHIFLIFDKLNTLVTKNIGLKKSDLSGVLLSLYWSHRDKFRAFLKS